MADREIKIVISAEDDYTAAMNKAKAAISGIGTATSTEAGKMASGWKNALGGISAAWVQVGAVIASGAWLIEARSKALEAEVAFNKLSIQVDNMGLSYKALTPEIERALDKTKEYAIAQDEDIAGVLQQLLLQTGNYHQSLASLNSVYDLAYLKNIDAGEAASIYSKAIGGNVEGLSRLFPELKNVDDILGKNATMAQKAAYAQAFLNEKVEGAKERMTEHEKATARVHQVYEDLHQAVGGYIIKDIDSVITAVKSQITFYNSLGDALERVAHYINPNIELTKKSIFTKEEEAKAIRLVGSAHIQTTAEIAAASKKENDEREKKKKQEEQYLVDLTARLKAFKVPEGDTSLTASIFGSLKAPEAQKGYELAGVILGENLSKGVIQGSKSGFDTMGTLNLDMGRFTKAFIPEPDAWAEALFFARVDAMGKLADLEKDNPYKYQKGTGGAMADVGLEYQTKLQALQDYNTQKLGLMAAAGATQYEVEAEYERLTTSMKKQELDLRLSAASSHAGGMANFFQNLYVAGGKHNRALFEMGKAFAIAEAVMNTASAATKALNAPPGPPWSFAYVAATVAAGAAQIATIMSTKPDGAGAISAAGTAMPSYSGGSPSAYPIPTALTPDSKPTQTIVINFQNAMGDAAYFQKITEENLIPAINAAADRNIAVTVRGAA